MGDDAERHVLRVRVTRQRGDEKRERIDRRDKTALRRRRRRPAESGVRREHRQQRQADADVLCRDDHATNPAWQRTAATERLGVDPVELDGGHSPMLSRPAELSDVLDGLARSTN
jgi:hypothetical protein